jgi:hypothetical protein
MREESGRRVGRPLGQTFARVLSDRRCPETEFWSCWCPMQFNSSEATCFGCWLGGVVINRPCGGVAESAFEPYPACRLVRERIAERAIAGGGYGLGDFALLGTAVSAFAVPPGPYRPTMNEQ